LGDVSQNCDTHVNNSNPLQHSIATAHLREKQVKVKPCHVQMRTADN
jgi:hypothetical protein